MLKQEQNHFIQPFLNSLEQELDIEGVSRERTAEIVEEAKDHLWAAMELDSPTNYAEVQEVIRKFGDARRMARGLGNAYRTDGAKRVYLWPAFLTGVMYLTYTSALLGPFTPYIFAAAATLMVALGFQTRRPMFGQFVALLAMIVVVMTPYSAIKSVPVVYDGFSSPNYQGAIPLGHVRASRNWFQQQILGNEKEISEMNEGAAFFRDPSGKTVPPFLRVGDRYLRPNQLCNLGQPERYYAEASPNVEEAKWQWTAIMATGGRTMAQLIADERTSRANEIRAALASLNKIEKQSIWERIPLAFVLCWHWAFWFSLISMFLANIGWMMWSIWSTASRWVRRLPLRA